jgi:hypothetical protein
VTADVTQLSRGRCEACETRPPVGLVILDDGTALLCEICIVDARALGLVEGGAA